MGHARTSNHYFPFCLGPYEHEKESRNDCCRRLEGEPRHFQAA